MARHTGRKPNANCSKKQNRTNPSVKNKKGKGQNMPNAGKKSKTMDPPRKIHYTLNEMIHIYSQHTTENHNNASHTKENQINANHTGKNEINTSSRKNRTKTEPCTSKKSRNTKKKLKAVRIKQNSEKNKEKKIDEFNGFREDDTTINATLIKPKIATLETTLKYLKKETSKKNKLKLLRIPNDSDFSEEEGALEKVDDEFDSFLGGDADQSFRNKKLNINLMSVTQKDQNIPIYRYKYMCENQKKTATMVVTVLVKKHSPRTANRNELMNQEIKEEDISSNEDDIEDPIVTNEGAIYDSDGYEIIDVDLF